MRASLLTFSLVLAALLAAVSPAGAFTGQTSCPDAWATPRTADPATLERAILCVINEERASAGLPVVTAQDGLTRAARAHSDDMVAARYFAHISPTQGSGTDRLKAAGYIRRGVDWEYGEILAWGEASMATPMSTLWRWMTSTGHRTVLMDPAWREVGIGVTFGSPAGPAVAPATVSVDFGRRTPVKRPAIRRVRRAAR